MSRSGLAAAAAALLALSATACGSGSEPDAGASTPSTGWEGFDDDFSDPSSGWPESDNGDGRFTRYEDGALRMVVDNDEYPYTVGYTTLEGDYGDVSMVIDAHQEDGPDNTGIGLGCRVAGDGGYYVDVSPAGQARLAIWPDGEQQVLEDVRGVELDAGDVTLELRCVGEDITFLVDGTEVISVRDESYASGGLSLSAGGAGAGTTDVRFDDLTASPVVTP